MVTCPVSSGVQRRLGRWTCRFSGQAFFLERLEDLLRRDRQLGHADADGVVDDPSKEAMGGFGRKTEREPESVAPPFNTTFTLENIQLTETGTNSLCYKPPGGKRFRTISTFDVGPKEEVS